MKKLPLLLLLALVAAFTGGVLHLFNLRFSAGDIYPAYSSLRADPLGVKALYESFESLLATRRNYRPLFRLGDGRDATLFYLGVEYAELRFSPNVYTHLEQFMADGGRLVIALFPRFQRPLKSWTRAKSSAGRSQEKQKTIPPTKPRRIPVGDEDDFPDSRWIPFTERWGLALEYAELSKDERGDFKPAVARCQTAEPLPKTLTCRSSLYFDKCTNTWRVIYAREEDRPVIIERQFGKGTLVLAADSYYFSNEALRRDRQPELLAWLAGASRHIIFDETHLGVREESGVATLARQYRLHGLLAMLLVLGALFVWKNSAGFMPPYEEEPGGERSDLILGKESAAGFVNLLRRNLRASEVLAVAFVEWKRTCSRNVSAARLQQLQAVMEAENLRPAKERNPVAAYRRLYEILASGGRKT